MHWPFVDDFSSFGWIQIRFAGLLSDSINFCIEPSFNLSELTGNNFICCCLRDGLFCGGWGDIGGDSLSGGDIGGVSNVSWSKTKI